MSSQKALRCIRMSVVAKHPLARIFSTSCRSLRYTARFSSMKRRIRKPLSTTWDISCTARTSKWMIRSSKRRSFPTCRRSSPHLSREVIKTTWPSISWSCICNYRRCWPSLSPGSSTRMATNASIMMSSWSFSSPSSSDLSSRDCRSASSATILRVTSVCNSRISS